MRFANANGRLALVQESEGSGFRGIDVGRASNGELPAGAAPALWRWDDVIDWASTFDGSPTEDFPDESLGPPSPAPAQIFAVGVNYADHLAEAGWDAPEVPMIFPKLSPAIAGPFDPVELSADQVDWEVELVVVIGRTARNVTASKAWDHVAGLTAGQDYSSRLVQMRPAEWPQFSLGKSLPGFAPIGPVLVTPDELPDRDNIELRCSVNGERVQHSRTEHLVFSVAALVEYLSGVTTLLPGDLIFTGTPSGVGAAMSPPRFLTEDDVVETHLSGIGAMRHRFVRRRPDPRPSDAPVVPHLSSR